MLNPHWLIIGPGSSWSTALEHGGIWGVRESLYPEWKALDPGDPVYFYVTKPVSGVVGVGTVTTKFIQDKPLWPDELEAKRVLYPLRFEIDVAYILEKQRWKTDRIKLPLTVQELKRGINVLLDRNSKTLILEIAQAWGVEIPMKGTILPEDLKAGAEKEESPTHKGIQDMLFEIGRMNRLISEKEYPIDQERLDVVWRRIERSVPTYAFEVQIGGDVYHALGKLKHAYDLWNSRVFLVAGEDQISQISALLQGTFNEIEAKLTMLRLAQVQELHQHKKKWVTLEKAIGLL